MDNKKLANIFNSFKKGFSKEDEEKVLKNENKILGIMKNQTLSKYLNDVTLYFQMLKDFFSGEYKNIPIGSIAAIVGTLLYVLSPIDLIPDFLPGGFLDDVGILIACLNFTKFDVEEYKKSKDENQQNQLETEKNDIVEKKQPLKSRLKKFVARAIGQGNLPGLAINKALDVVVPSLADRIIQSKICPLIKEKIESFYKNTVRNSLITLALNIIGVLLVIFDPFGEKISFNIACIFFGIAISFSICRFIIFITNKQNRDISIQLIQNVWKTKSISKGIKEIVLINIPVLAKFYKGIDIASNFLPALDKIPDIQEITKYVINVFWKRFVLFIGLFATYITMVYFVIKPVLLNIFL